MDAYLERLQERIASATRGMDGEQLRRHPEGKWCALEVLEHLYLTYAGTVKGFERCLKEGKPLARKPVFQDRIKALIVTGLMHMPTGRKAPERAQPRAYVSPPVTSMPTYDSSPTTHASCPAGISTASPGPTSISSPVSITTCIRPEMQ